MWALPLSSCRRGAGNVIRTRDIQLGRLTLYQLSYSRGFRFPEWWWREKDSNLRRREPADLQSAPFGRSGIPPLRWSLRTADGPHAQLPTTETGPSLPATSRRLELAAGIGPATSRLQGGCSAG